MSLLSLGALLPFCGIATLWIVKIRIDLKEFIDLRKEKAPITNLDQDKVPCGYDLG
jgi:hypothetical protein